jgi:hypothetical protein
VGRNWYQRSVFINCVLVKRTRSKLVKKISEHSAGVVKDPSGGEVGGWEKMRVLRSKVWANMLERMRSLPEADEKVALDTLMEELFVNFGGSVSINLDLSREGGGGQQSIKELKI